MSGLERENERKEKRETEMDFESRWIDEDVVERWNGMGKGVFFYRHQPNNAFKQHKHNILQTTTTNTNKQTKSKLARKQKLGRFALFAAVRAAMWGMIEM